MAITGVNNYNSVYESTYALSKKEAANKEETKETAAAQKSAETAKNSRNEECLKNLQKQVPYMKTIIEAAREEDEGKTTVKNRLQVGANLDLKI